MSNLKESKDIYETEDLPEADQAYDNYEDNVVELLNVNRLTAFNRFKGKSIDQKITKNPKQLSYIDNPFGKAKRIKDEIDELKSKIEKMDDSAKVTEKEPVTKEQLLVLIEALNKQLEELDLEKKLKNIDLNLCCKPNVTYKRLLDCIKTIQQGKDKASADKDDKSENPLNYEIKYNKPINDYIHMTRLTNLSKRLDKLERVLGQDNLKLANVVSECPSVNRKSNSSKKMNEAGGILEAVERLMAKSNLLHGPMLTAIESRMSYVETKLGKIRSVASDGAELDLESQNKIASMYELIKKWDNVVDTVPKLLENCREMQDLHNQCAKMSQSIYHVNLKHDELVTKVEADKIAINNIQKNIETNFNTIDENVKSLESRLIKL